jgi:hypothetical protein
MRRFRRACPARVSRSFTPTDCRSPILRHPVVFDGRNVYDPEVMRQHGFAYHGIGRAPVELEA